MTTSTRTRRPLFAQARGPFPPELRARYSVRQNNEAGTDTISLMVETRTTPGDRIWAAVDQATREVHVSLVPVEGWNTQGHGEHGGLLVQPSRTASDLNLNYTVVGRREMRETKLVDISDGHGRYRLVDGPVLGDPIAKRKRSRIPDWALT